MSTGSLRLGTIFGIDVRVHWSVAVIALVLGANLVGAIGFLAAAAGVVAFLGSILAHELAHALTARRFDVGTESIQLWALGGVARLEREAPSAKAEGWIAAAGPIASVSIAAAAIGGWVALGASTGGRTDVALLGWLGLVNALLAIFNLLPGSPLDGGRILKAVRWAMHGDKYRAAREAGRAGLFLGALLVAGGFVLMVRAQSGFWLLITGVFIMLNAQVETGAAELASRLAGVKVRDLTWFGVAAAGDDMDADSMLWQRQRLGGAGGVAVTDVDGHLQGLVLEDELWSVPADQRPWVMLTQMMVPIDRVARAAPDEELVSVLPRLNPARPLVSVWQDGRLVGLVPPRVLRERLRLAESIAG